MNVSAFLLLGVVKRCDKVTLNRPSAGQCQEMIRKLKDDHQYSIYLKQSSPDIVCLLMSQEIRTIKRINIKFTKVTEAAIFLLANKITNNTSLEVLAFINDSINNDGVIALTRALISNKTITDLHLNNNPDITSACAQSLAELLRYNHTLSVLSLHRTNIDTDGVLVLFESLRTNNTLRTLWLDSYKHRKTCCSICYCKDMKKRLCFF